MTFAFRPGARDGETRARRGTLTTARGVVETPAFMPVGTRASVTGLAPDDLRAAGAEIILANTYHLLLRPGPELFRRIGGIHGFMGWDRPVLTDSGGFQIFSLPGDRTLTEVGARFRSYVDQRFHLLSPERSIEVQTAIGSDVMMVLDVCLPSTVGGGRGARRDGPDAPLGAPQPRRPHEPRPGALRHRPGRPRPGAGARSRRGSSPSTRSTASPSAASRSATRAPSATTSSSGPRSCSRRTGRAT